MKVIQVINSENRNASLDLFRCLAIVSVVLYHFGYLPYGYIGVDLFFVISGTLIGGILIKSFHKAEKINYWKFILQRGGKIWPSYYFFLCAGTLVACILYKETDPDQIIPLRDFKRYVFFYQNYTGAPFHWSFDHIWSICVEEHFYLALPILFILVKKLWKSNYKVLVTATAVTIVLGFLSKYLMFYYSTGKDTYSATHNRIDALAWGVLIAIIVYEFDQYLRATKKMFLFFILGVIGIVHIIYLEASLNNTFYTKVIFHTLLPICFALMVFGLYFQKFGNYTKPFSFIAYYSYNWYLWHPVFVLFLHRIFPQDHLGLVVYLTISFGTAMLTTIFVEEPFLKLRDRLLKSGSKNITLKKDIFSKKEVA